jgi:two-component system response regulator EvgA
MARGASLGQTPSSELVLRLDTTPYVSATVASGMKGIIHILTVIIVEDSPPMQQILIKLVGTEPSLELVAVVDNPADAMTALKKDQPNLVILDLALRAGNGIDLIIDIKKHKPECRVLVFTAYDAEQYRIRSTKAGADWFFSKNRQHRELVESLSNIAAGIIASGKSAPAKETK